MTGQVYPTALLGYRAWFFNQGLFSMGLGAEEWRSRNKKAKCKRGMNHQAPDGDCTCGLYAFYDFSEVENHQKGLILDLGMSSEEKGKKDREAKNSFSIVVGAVAARGRVELHWNGFRAEEMQILALLVSPEQARDPWLGRQDIPLYFSPETLEKNVARYAKGYPEQLRPSPPLKEEEMRDFPGRFLSLENEEQYCQLARSLNLEIHELGDMALHLGLPLPRW